MNFQRTTAVVSGMNDLQIQTKLKSSKVVLMMAMTCNRDAKWSYIVDIKTALCSGYQQVSPLQ